MTITKNNKGVRFESEELHGIKDDGKPARLFSGRTDIIGCRFQDQTKITETGKNSDKHYSNITPLMAINRLWHLHLRGELEIFQRPASLGIYPDKDGKCSFGAIDLDIYKDLVNHKKLAKEIACLRFPLVVCQSSSGGAHLYIRFTEPVEVRECRKVLRSMADALGFINQDCSEIFPKTSKGKCGYFLNMPYYKGNSRVGFDDEGNQMDFKRFLTYFDSLACTKEQLGILNLSALQRKVKEDGTFEETGTPYSAETNDGKASRQKRLLWIARYLKSRYPEKWKEISHQHNSEFVKHDINELNGIHKSLEKEDYTPDKVKEKIEQSKTTWLTMSKTLGEMARAPRVEKVWLLHEVIAFGMVFLNGASTVGKSWFLLQLAFAVATNTTFLGRKIKSGSVLFLALEDTFDEILDRYEILGHKREDITHINNLRFITLDSEGEMPKMNNGYEDFIKKWINEVENFSDEPVLMVTDTYEKIRSYVGGGMHKMTSYSMDVQTLGPTHKLLKSEKVVGIFSNHLTKQSYQDIWKEIMGSGGIMATSDQAILMRGRGQAGSDIEFIWRGRYGQGGLTLKQKVDTAQFVEVDTSQNAGEFKTIYDRLLYSIVQSKGICQPKDLHQWVESNLNKLAGSSGRKITYNEKQNWTKRMARMVEHEWFVKVKGGKYKAVEIEIPKLKPEKQLELLKIINAF